MNLSSLVTDNVTEILVKIIKFTKTRKEVLSENISQMSIEGFIPKDLEVDDFSELMNNAINEHIQNHRLVLCDTDHIKFGKEGFFQIQSVIDDHAMELLQTDPDEYLELQINKLLENSLNQRVAAELLKQKEGMTLNFE
jgi:flagellar basal body rod protein FlgB